MADLLGYRPICHRRAATEVMNFTTSPYFITHELDPTTSDSYPVMLWSSLRACFQGGTSFSDRAQRSARQIETPRVYDRSGNEPAATYEHDSIEFQTMRQQHLMAVPPRRSNDREDTVVVL